VALTGGVAAGKSRVAGLFEELGAPCSDADAIAREVVAPGTEGLQAVVEAFDQAVLGSDGSLDRRVVRERIFNDDTARRALEAILHPRIRTRMSADLDAYQQAGHSYAIAVVPLLVETGQDNDYDRVLVVDAPEEVQRHRLLQRDGGSTDQARAIMARQARRHGRLEAAHDVVTNGDPLPTQVALASQVRCLDHKYRLLAEIPV